MRQALPAKFQMGVSSQKVSATALATLRLILHRTPHHLSLCAVGMEVQPSLANCYGRKAEPLGHENYGQDGWVGMVPECVGDGP
jgi:hypothetical protein